MGMTHGAASERDEEQDIAGTDELSSPESTTDSELLRVELAELRLELRALRETIERQRFQSGATTIGVPAAKRPNSHGREGLTRFHRPTAAFRTSITKQATRAASLRQAPGTAIAVAKSYVAEGVAGTEWKPPRSLLTSIAAFVAVTIAAFLLRGIHVDRIPEGFHGDEAATGIEARLILEKGWVGVYSGIAGGNPTGVYYLATIPIKLIDDPVVAVRMLSAVLGTLAVSLLFIIVLRNFGFGSAVAAGVLFAFAEWHIQFSRIGFVTGDWTTCVLLGVLALAEAVRTQRWYWWAASGFFVSAATYIYNGNGPLLILIGVFVLWVLFGWGALVFVAAIALAVSKTSPLTIIVAISSVSFVLGRRVRDRCAWTSLGAYALASLLTLRGLIDFVRAHPQDYFGRGKDLSVFRSDPWHATSGTFERGRFLFDRYLLFWQRLTFEPRPNGADLSGVTPLVPRLTLAIFAVGLVVALIRRPTPLVLLSTAIVMAIPLTSVLTDLTLRRAVVIVPFMAILGGIGLVEVFRLGYRRGRRPAIFTGLLSIILVGASCRANYVDFFDKTVYSQSIRATFPIELRRSSDYMASLPVGSYVYLFCDNWGIKYDVVVLIAPDVRGEDRLPKWGGNGSMSVDWSKGQPVFLFVGAEIKQLDAVKRIYPGGRLVVGPALPEPFGESYVAYFPALS